MFRKLHYIIIIAILTSCATKVTHGIILEDKNINAIMPNITRKEDVKNLLGNPSFVINNSWYYITTIKKYRAFFIPKTVKHEAYILHFNENTVSKIEQKTHNDIEITPVPMHKIKTKKPNLKKIYNAN